MKTLRHPVWVALGTTTLCLLFLLGPFVSPSHSLIYHLSGPPLGLFASVAIDFCLLWLLLTGLIWLAGTHARLFVPIWWFLLVLLPWVVLKSCAILTAWLLPHWLSVAVLVLPTGLTAVLLCFRRSDFRSIFDRAQRFIATLLGFMAMAGVVILTEFCWFAWQARSLNGPTAGTLSGGTAEGAASRPRIVWLLLDELSYQQVYERRFPGLELPALDGLAAESVVMTHTLPPAMVTEAVVPSLLTGIPTDRIRVSADGRLLALRDPSSGAWRSFDARGTIFQDARAVGYKTGLAGWFNPYCRILPAVLDWCYWANRDPRVEFMRDDATLSAKLSSPFQNLAAYFRRSMQKSNSTSIALERDAEQHIRDYTDIYAAGDSLLADRSIDFVLLHLPVPHPGGIYDRKRGELTTSGGSYLDNLALADRYLAHVRQVLERQREWDSACVLVMGDHSWRTQLLWGQVSRMDARRGTGERRREVRRSSGVCRQDAAAEDRSACRCAIPRRRHPRSAERDFWKSGCKAQTI